MRALSALFLLVACTGTPDTDSDTDVVDSDTDTDVVDTDAERPLLPLPPEAEDLDPAPDVLSVRLVAAAHRYTIGDDEVDGYAYNGSVPGPTLRAKVGDTVTAEIVNQLDVPTTVHWHGPGTPYEMDGVTWTTAPIAPGETFVATFTVDRPGTFWYHPHFDTARQVDLGLYGALVVEDPDEPTVDHDLVIVADAWGEAGSRTPEAGENHHGLDGVGLEWTFNGALDPVLPVAAGETARLRIINASNTGYLDLVPTENARFIAGDQGLRASASTRELVGPGDRTEVELRVGSDPEGLGVMHYSLYGGSVDDGVELARVDLVPEGGAAPPDPVDWPFPSAAPSPDPGRTDLRFVLQGDATQDAWFINGEVFPDVTVSTLELGQDVVVEVRNISPTDHPFHMHGHPFEVLSIDGVPVAERRIEDTINVGIRQVVRLRFLATNPGFWMTHCHILPHADGGMMTVVQVE